MSRKPLAVLGLVAPVAGCAHGRSAAQPAAATAAGTAPAQGAPPARTPAVPTPASVALGLPPVGPGPVPGYVLIADRDNSRLLVVSPSKRSSGALRGPGTSRAGSRSTIPTTRSSRPAVAQDERIVVFGGAGSDSVLELRP